jgi:hypothetical protein
MPSAAQIRYLTDLGEALSPYITGGGGTDAEVVRDTIGAALVAGTNITITVNDAANTITIDASGGGGGITAEDARDTIGTALTAGTGIAIVVNDPADTITVSTTVRGAQGTVDFGSVNDYAEVTIAATWVTASHRIIPSVRGGTADHPLADEDAALEELHPVVVAITAATSITVGVHAPYTTTGQYLVDVMGAV